MVGRVGGSGERPDINQLKKFVSPDIKHKTEGKENLALGRQVVKNLTKIVLAKFNRIINGIKTGEWVNNAEVARKLTVTIKQLNVQANGLLGKKTVDGQAEVDFLQKAMNDATSLEKVFKKRGKENEDFEEVKNELSEFKGKVETLANKVVDATKQFQPSVAETVKEKESPPVVDKPETKVKHKPFKVDLSDDINAARKVDVEKPVVEPEKKHKNEKVKESVEHEQYRKVVNQIKQRAHGKVVVEPVEQKAEEVILPTDTPIIQLEKHLKSFIEYARKEKGFLDDRGDTVASAFREIDDDRVEAFTSVVQGGLSGSISDQVEQAHKLLDLINDELVRERLAQKDKKGNVTVLSEHSNLKKHHQEMKQEVGRLISALRLEVATAPQAAIIGFVKKFIEEARNHGFADEEGYSSSKVNIEMPLERLMALNEFMDSDPRKMSIEEAEAAILAIKGDIDSELVRVKLATKNNKGITVTDQELKPLYLTFLSIVADIRDPVSGYDTADDSSSEYESAEDSSEEV